MRFREHPQHDAARTVLEFPAPLGVAKRIRSTLLTSSLQSLRARSLYERYQAALSPEYRELVLNCVAGQWLPLEVGEAHYRACDSLGLSVDEQVGIGRDVSKRIHETFLAVAARMAKTVGVTPWPLLAKGNVLYGRLFDAGGMQVTRVAAKAARIEIAGLPLLDNTYFRNGVLGVYAAGVELVGSQVSTRTVSAESTNYGRRTVIRADWV